MRKFSTYIVYLICAFILAAALPVSAENSDDFPKLDHVLMLDCSGSMVDGTYRVEGVTCKGGGYGAYEKGFYNNIITLLKEILQPKGKALQSQASCLILPACHDGSLIEERWKQYKDHSKNLTLKDAATQLQAKSDDGKALFPGPLNDGSLGGDNLKTELDKAIDYIRDKYDSDFTCIWFLTDNGKNSEAPIAYLDYIRHEESFAQVFFCPLGILKDGECGLALYLIVRKNSPSVVWKDEWTEVFTNAVNSNLANLSCLENDFTPMAIDMRGVFKTYKNGADGIKLKATPAAQLQLNFDPDYITANNPNWQDISSAKEARQYKIELKENSKGSNQSKLGVSYQYAASIKGEIRPCSGWVIRNINVESRTDTENDGTKAKNIQDYTPLISSEDAEVLQENLKIDFNEMSSDRLSSREQETCRNYGSIYTCWIIHANVKAIEIIKKYEQGIDLELVFDYPTYIDFSPDSANKEQSGFNPQILKNIPHCLEIEQAILEIHNEGTRVSRSWSSDEPVIFNISYPNTSFETYITLIKPYVSNKKVLIILGILIASGCTFFIYRRKRH